MFKKVNECIDKVILKCNQLIEEEESSEDDSSLSGTAYLSSISSGSLELLKEDLKEFKNQKEIELDKYKSKNKK